MRLSLLLLHGLTLTPPSSSYETATTNAVEESPYRRKVKWQPSTKNKLQQDNNRKLSSSSSYTPQCDDPNAYFQIRKILSDGSELCMQPDSTENILYLTCQPHKKSQQWRADCQGRIRNKRNDEKGLRKDGTTLKYKRFDDDAVVGTSYFAFSELNGDFLANCIPKSYPWVGATRRESSRRETTT